MAHIPDKMPWIEPNLLKTFANLDLFILEGKIIKNNIIPIPKQQIDIMKIIIDIVFDFPEFETEVPKSLKKLFENEYPGLDELQKCPPL